MATKKAATKKRTNPAAEAMKAQAAERDARAESRKKPADATPGADATAKIIQSERARLAGAAIEVVDSLASAVETLEAEGNPAESMKMALGAAQDVYRKLFGADPREALAKYRAQKREAEKARTPAPEDHPFAAFGHKSV